MSPRVSVVVCAYNAQDHLAETIDSVLAQTLPDFELLVVDDGSKDRTGEIVKSYAARDPRVRYHFQPNAGFGAARNTCLKLAAADWIAIIDHDDVCLPERLQIQLAAAKDAPDADFVFSNSEHFRDDGTIERRQFDGFNPCRLDLRAPRAAEELLTHACFIDSETAFFRKSAALAAGGFREDYRYINDFDFFLRLGLRSRFVALDRVLARWRIHAKQLSQTAEETIVAEHLALYRDWLEKPGISDGARRAAKMRLLAYTLRAARFPALRERLGGLPGLAGAAAALRPRGPTDYRWCAERALGRWTGR